MGRTYRIGTRTSPLALIQADEILKVMRGMDLFIEAEIVGIDTYGDKDKVTPISRIEGTDFFTREIDEALIKGEIDIAVHSAKDLPDALRRGIAAAVITPSIDPADVIVSKGDLGIDELPPGSKIGTSAERRKEQIRKYRPDLEIVDIRGNIEERLRLLDGDDARLDAILIAAAGLVRLGMEKRIAQRLPANDFKPHPMQGALAIIVREGDIDAFQLTRACFPEGQATKSGRS